MERAQGARLVGRGAAASGPGTTCPTSSPTGRRPTARPPGATGVAAISGTDPFIMQADGKAWLFAPAGLVDGPLPAHYEPQESPFRNPLYGQQHNPVRQIIRHPREPVPAERRRARIGRVPVRDHHLPADRAPHRRRHVPVPALPGGAAARVLLRGLAGAGRRARPGAPRLGDDHHRPQRHRGPGAGHRADAAAAGAGRTLHQVGLPWHWGPNGLHHRGRRQRAVPPVAGPERAHPGGQGHGLRHPPRAAAARSRPARPRRGPTSSGPASPTQTGTEM